MHLWYFLLWSFYTVPLNKATALIGFGGALLPQPCKMKIEPMSTKDITSIVFLI